MSGANPVEVPKGVFFETDPHNTNDWRKPMTKYFEWIMSTARSVEQIDRLPEFAG